MPHSWHYPTTLIQEKVALLQPLSVLDVGAGYGKWGFLLREQLDWNPGRLDPSAWKARIVGVEVHPYQSPLHEWVYDEIVRADVLDIVDSCVGYDLVLLSDVIEHIGKEAGQRLLEQLVAANRNVIVSTPLDFFTQDIADNEHEHHVSHWTLADFTRFTFDYDTAAGAAMVITLAGRDAVWPTERDSRISRFIYRVPMIGHHSAAARALKQAIVRASRLGT